VSIATLSRDVYNLTLTVNGSASRTR